MPFEQNSLDNYIDVAERIALFYDRFPEGSLQQADLQFKEFAGKQWVVYTAAAFRTPDDEHPGIGTAWEQVPGKTNFTRDSEVQNAETSAWGRAIVACGILGSRGAIASKQEVRNRQADREEGDRKTATIRAIAIRTPDLEADERKRQVEEFLGKSVDEADSLELQAYLNTLPVPAEAAARVDRALAKAAKSLPRADTPPEA